MKQVISKVQKLWKPAGGIKHNRIKGNKKTGVLPRKGLEALFIGLKPKENHQIFRKEKLMFNFEEQPRPLRNN